MKRNRNDNLYIRSYARSDTFPAIISTPIKYMIAKRYHSWCQPFTNMVVKTSGIVNYLYLMGVISLSLGTTNLLPFPPLDGGKILLYIIEAIRRKPLNETFVTKLQVFGFTLLIVLSIYITYLDILRI